MELVHTVVFVFILYILIALAAKGTAYLIRRYAERAELERQREEFDRDQQEGTL